MISANLEFIWEMPEHKTLGEVVIVSAGSPPWSVAEFVDFLLSHSLGQIVICNILDGHEDGLVQTTTVKNYFEWWIALCDDKELETIEATIGAMNSLTPIGYPPELAEKRGRIPQFLFACRVKPKKSSSSDTLANVIKFTDLGYSVDSDDLKDRQIEIPLVRHSDWANRIANRLLALSSEERVVKLKDGGQIGAAVLWVTRGSDFDKAVGAAISMNNAADRARDVLGLVDHKPDDILIVLQLPWKVMEVMESERPTFMDAGSHRRFQAVARLQKNRRRSAWGCTVDLARLSDKSANADGLPERVRRPVKGNELGPERTFGFSLLGQVAIDRDTDPPLDGDNAFAQFLMRGRTTETLRKSVLDIVE